MIIALPCPAENSSKRLPVVRQKDEILS